MDESQIDKDFKELLLYLFDCDIEPPIGEIPFYVKKSLTKQVWNLICKAYAIRAGNLFFRFPALWRSHLLNLISEHRHRKIDNLSFGGFLKYRQLFISGIEKFINFKRYFTIHASGFLIGCTHKKSVTVQYLHCY